MSATSFNRPGLRVFCFPQMGRRSRRRAHMQAVCDVVYVLGSSGASATDACLGRDCICLKMRNNFPLWWAVQVHIPSPPLTGDQKHYSISTRRPQVQCTLLIGVKRHQLTAGGLKRPPSRAARSSSSLSLISTPAVDVRSMVYGE